MTAPNFGESEYSSAGERIGPAWQMMWDLLDGKRIPISRQTIIEITLSGGIELLPKTLANLLRQAANIGLLEKTYSGPNRKVYYRRTDVIPATEGSTP